MDNPTKVTLYKNHKNKIGFWRGWCDENKIIIEYASGVHDSPQRIEELIHEGKQGRSANEQAIFRLTSRVNSKLDAGYVMTYAEATVAPTDALGQTKPMLAQSIKDYNKTIDPNNAFIQLKYNGHRCFIGNKDGNVFAYSRNGKPMPGIKHIVESMKIPDGVVLDGEIYRHGWRLQEIASKCKKLQMDSLQLNFVNYDYVSTDPFSERIQSLKSLKDALGPHTKIAATKRLSEIDNMKSALEKARASGYEGLMMRIDGAGYEAGRRSSSLLKIKKFDDAEFIVVDVLSSKDGWGILVCQLPNGGTFKVSAPGTMYEKANVLKNKELYIGRAVTVEYSELTAAGVPFHPVALQFREDL